jgi:hypothetical protein
VIVRTFQVRAILRALTLSLLFLPASGAEDAVFEKSILTATGGSKPTPVHLIISEAAVSIQGKTNRTAIVELPYGAITKISYTFMERRRASLVPVYGISALLLKGQSHWLVIESSGGSSDGRPTVLRLDKREYRGVIAALNSKSGKRVEVLDPGSALADPTIGSKDQDEIVPFRVDQALAAIEPAMEQYSCKIRKRNGNRTECKRSLIPRDGIGGGEGVIAVVEAKGPETRIQIRTLRGLGRNWSLPIYREMVGRLKSAR